MTLPGFFVSGFLLALLGAALPGWGYHLSEQHSPASLLFLALASGLMLAVPSRLLLAAVSIQVLRLVACFLAGLVLSLFALWPPPVSLAIQFGLWLALGGAAGLLNNSLFLDMRDSYHTNPAATLARAGLSFVAGGATAAFAVAASYRFGFVSQTPLALAAVPVAFGALSLRLRPSPVHQSPELPLRLEMLKFSKPGALVFALLLLLESGSEWTVAGWLAVFLAHRIGAGPETAVWMLALYWSVLLASRAANSVLLARLPHGRFLIGSTVFTLLGCLLLVATDNPLGAITGILLLGIGFAGIFPLLASKMSTRFPEFHAGLFNAIFSFALAGGLLLAWFAGNLADWFGLFAIVALPAAATFLSATLLLVLWLESKVTGR